MQDVVEASRQVPVLVDFWATWCGPCKTLTPTIEKVVRAAGGRVRLVKIDIDKNRALVQQLMQFGLPLQSVPTVAAFWQGQIADLFQGALPEGEVKKFVEGLLKLAGGQMPSADLLAEAKAAAAEGDHQERAGALRRAGPGRAGERRGAGRRGPQPDGARPGGAGAAGGRERAGEAPRPRRRSPPSAARWSSPPRGAAPAPSWRSSRSAWPRTPTTTRRASTSPWR